MSEVVYGGFVMKSLRCPRCGHHTNDAVCRCEVKDRRCAQCGTWWHRKDGESVIGRGHSGTRRTPS